MARLISFSMTEAAILDRSKTVTRRLGWRNLRPGEELRAVRKVMGRKKGEPLVDLARIRVVSVRREPLGDIDENQRDVAREGYPELTLSQFVRMFCSAMGCTEETEVTRIEFEYLEPDGQAKVQRTVCTCGRERGQRHNRLCLEEELRRLKRSSDQLTKKLRRRLRRARSKA